MMTKWLHLSELGGDPWVLPIWTAVNEAVKSGKVATPSPEVGRLGLHVSIRLNILPRVVQRVNSSTSLLYEKTKEHGPEYVFTEAQEGYAYPIDNDLKYSLLADIDALLFELNSACELMTRLFGLLHAHVGRPIPPKQLGKAIGDVLAQGTQNARWFVLLDKHRNFFMHEGAPYLAVDLSNGPATLDILIMKENIKTFTDPDTFVSLSEINLIVQGFIAARRRLQDYLVSLFR
jgi:hypothetical protein